MSDMPALTAERGIVAPHGAMLTGEALKAQLVQVSPERSRDALYGVIESPLATAVQEVTVGPYNGELNGQDVKNFLSSPSEVLVVGCGRNEAQNGNLAPNLAYMQESTNGAGNVLFVDANSTDNSVDTARAMGVDVLRRGDVLTEVVDRRALAEILAIPPEVLEGKEITRQPPLRKGIDVLIARILLLQAKKAGLAPKHVLFSDTDLKSIPGGSLQKYLIGMAQVENKTADEKGTQLKDPTEDRKVYRPLQLVARAAIDLNKKRRDGREQQGIFTGSENRNNESIFVFGNMAEVDSVSPFLNERQREIALALSVTPDLIVHPLTGELIIATDSELRAMGATGQCVEIARIISLAGEQHTTLGSSDPQFLKDVLPLVGNVRRGEQQRIDEPQTDAKEWWMIGEVIPKFWRATTEYMIQTGKFSHEFSMEDYTRLNRWLRDSRRGSRLNNQTQTREIDEFPMERAIPSVQQLDEAGLLKI
ncbi:MAG: hypothetical protein A3J14_01375 [Candidatus Levybacteria bacterium RIFCSPLOWO2_02_FULL_37_18]|nr:MAG: hypothetical protein A3J14_01375 [Candidatus Levybacteria bacterium RIFCSPLOWO2_02_FULL_37_18]